MKLGKDSGGAGFSQGRLERATVATTLLCFVALSLNLAALPQNVTNTQTGGRFMATLNSDLPGDSHANSPRCAVGKLEACSVQSEHALQN